VVNFYLVFILGIIFGSFLNVVIYRLPENDRGSILYSRSYCPNCKTELKWHDMIPILSYVFQKGKCKYCGAKISWQYPVVEFLNGMLYVLLYWKYLNSTWTLLDLAVYMVLFSALLVGSVIDLKHQILPDTITLGGIGLGLLLSLTTAYIGVTEALIGFCVGFIPLAIIVMIRPDALGGGDVKLMGMFGVFLGWEAVLNILIIGSIVASVINIILIVSKDNKFKEPFPFGPYLVFASFVSILILNNNLIYNYLM
jgi:leader peptidase (prepilin peptidase)/N-methyltransferase